MRLDREPHRAQTSRRTSTTSRSCRRGSPGRLATAGPRGQHDGSRQAQLLSLDLAGRDVLASVPRFTATAHRQPRPHACSGHDYEHDHDHCGYHRPAHASAHRPSGGAGSLGYGGEETGHTRSRHPLRQLGVPEKVVRTDSAVSGPNRLRRASRRGHRSLLRSTHANRWRVRPLCLIRSHHASPIDAGNRPGTLWIRRGRNQTVPSIWQSAAQAPG